MRILVAGMFTAMALAARPAAAQQQAGDTSMTPEKRMVISLKSDLRNLVVAQEQYFADHKRYAPQLSDLKFRASTDNTAKLLVAEELGWSAETRTPKLGVVCIIYVNLPADKRPVTSRNKRTGAEGEPVCDLDP